MNSLSVWRRLARWSLTRLDDETARTLAEDEILRRWPPEWKAAPVGAEPESGPCPECGLPLPGPHRGTCSASLALGGPGFGLPPRKLEDCGGLMVDQAVASKLRAAVNDAADRGLTVKQLVRVFDEALDAIKRERGE